MPGFKVCISTLYDVRTTTKSPNDTFSERFPVAKRRMTVFFYTLQIERERDISPVIFLVVHPTST
jgi:hypothetical protein